jgi:hypothetical protein
VSAGFESRNELIPGAAKNIQEAQRWGERAAILPELRHDFTTLAVSHSAEFSEFKRLND